MDKYIFKPELINENARINDLFTYTNIKKGINKMISQLSTPAILGIIGAFGIGKSTTLYQIENDTKDVVWINFDSWKYPDRNSLWEGFILDFAEQIGNQKHVLKIIKGEATGAIDIDIITDIASSISNIPGLNVIDKLFKKVFNISPAKRVFELQKILKEMIEKQSKKIIIVIEDIDRSGDAGIFFLETLKQFLKIVNKQIVIVVPIGDKNFEIHKESYLKCIDYIYFFRPENIEFDNFTNEITNTDLFKESLKLTAPPEIRYEEKLIKYQIASFFKALFETESNMTIRLLKLILRNSNLAYNNMLLDKLNPDIRVIICTETAKYFSPKIELDKIETYFKIFKKSGLIGKSNIYAAFLGVIFNNYDSLYKDNKIYYFTEPVKLTSTPNIKNDTGLLRLPWYNRTPFNEYEGYWLNDSYFNY